MKVDYNVENSVLSTDGETNTHLIKFTATAQYTAPVGDCFVPAKTAVYSKATRVFLSEIAKMTHKHGKSKND